MRAKLLLFVGVTVLSLLVLEGGLRLFWRPPARFMGGELRKERLFVPDETVGWRMTPNTRVDFRWHWGETSTIETNSFGFRDVEHAHERTPNVPRVLVLGDSHAFGYGVRVEETFAAQLRKLLPGTEILNLAVTGYNTRQARALLTRDGKAFRPDIVVLAFCQNDIAPQEIPSARSVTTPPQRDPWYVRSYLVRLLRDRVNSSLTLARFAQKLGIKDEPGGYEMLDPDLRPALLEYPPELDQEWQDTCAELRRLRDGCTAIGARLVVASIPIQQAVETTKLGRSLTFVRYDPHDFDLGKPYRMLRDFCSAEAVPFVDAYPTFVAAQQRGDRPYFEHDLHINARGHRIVAELLAPCLREMLENP